MIRRFRIPIACIQGATGLLEDTQLPDEKRQEFLRVIRKETAKLEESLAEILEFSHPRRPRLSEVDPGALIENVIRQSRTDGRQSVTIRSEVAAGLPKLHGDPALIVRMLEHMVSNAVEATSASGTVRILAGVEADRLVFSVIDRGRGIAPGTAQRIYDPFFSTREDGLGLGLTVAHQIAHAHRGTISVKDFEGGTCISAALPLDSPLA
jgi:signal transduction histidine kinase